MQAHTHGITEYPWVQSSPSGSYPQIGRFSEASSFGPNQIIAQPSGLASLPRQSTDNSWPDAGTPLTDEEFIEALHTEFGQFESGTQEAGFPVPLWDPSPETQHLMAAEPIGHEQFEHLQLYTGPWAPFLEETDVYVLPCANCEAKAAVDVWTDFERWNRGLRAQSSYSEIAHALG
jgi:hypothetical protein